MCEILNAQNVLLLIIVSFENKEGFNEKEVEKRHIVRCNGDFYGY